MEQVKYLHAPVMAGIVLLKSAGMARFMNANVARVPVSDSLIEEMQGAKSREACVEKSIDIAAHLLKQVKDLCQGVHSVAFGWERLIPAVPDGRRAIAQIPGLVPHKKSPYRDYLLHELAERAVEPIQGGGC